MCTRCVRSFFLLLYFLQNSYRKDLRFSWVLPTSFHSSPLTKVLFRGRSAGGKYTSLNWLRGGSLIFCWSDSLLTKETATAPKGSAFPRQCLLPKMAISCLLRPGGTCPFCTTCLCVPGGENVKSCKHQKKQSLQCSNSAAEPSHIAISTANPFKPVDRYN